MPDPNDEPLGPSAENSSPPLEDQITEKLDQLWPKDFRVAAGANLAAGYKVANYKIRALLGTGAFGVVYLADDEIENRPVALKLPRLEVLYNPAKRKRFSTEAKIAANFDHPGIVKIYAFDMAGPTPYIATQWCDGGDLRKWKIQQMAQGSASPPWQDVVMLMADVADAVHYAHENGVVHRDLKPANILLFHKLDQDSQGSSRLADFQAKVTDFGLAKLKDPNIIDTHSSLMVGTPIYMAPEQLSRPVDDFSNPAAADIYSLGAILFEMLTGESPIQGESYFEVLDNIQNRSPRSLSQFPHRLPADLNMICSICLSKNPDARYDTAAKLAEDLRTCASEGCVVGKSINVLARSKFWFGRQDWFSIAGWFAIGSQMLVTIWLVLGDLSKVFFGLLTMQEYFDILPILILLAVTTSFSMIFFAVFTIRRRKWAAWCGAVLAAINLSAPVLAIINQPVVFKDIYNNSDPYFSFQIHLILLLCFGCQLILFLCAAWPRKRVGNLGS
ncbi:protein kinase [bacterium]|nr:protein kinase [bacterium]